ncbi:hypothetical protein [Enhygromyxa salina]|uniref:Lipoprotein n=1 Tax=Enhygromyxa salina TaxID=215803 RepID=A0A2S9YND3_9BACT|nr:hypothetical protein [Enhygromyxa salina]PRQ06596.1 hypothetical protein ENSA7_36990 [Enhygromyxa salina]
MLRSTRPLLALLAVAPLAVGCADIDTPIGDGDAEAGETEGETEAGEGGEAEGGEELEACIETVTVLPSQDIETPEGHKPRAALEAAEGARILGFEAISFGEVSVKTSAPEVANFELSVAHEGGEVRHVESVPSDGSAATCVSRVELDVTLRLLSEDGYFDSELAAVLVAQIGEEGLEAPTVVREVEDLAELGSVKLDAVKPADPSALVYAVNFVFSTEGATGELGGVASYEEPGVDGDTIVSAHVFKLFAFSE